MDYYQKYLKYKDKYTKLKELRGGGESESEIAIVCHCSKLKNRHPQLYFIYKDKSIPMKKIDENIRYVDTSPECRNEDSWEKITTNSLKYIWGIGCPIYKSFENSAIIENILSQASFKLKVGGQVYFANYYYNDVQMINDDQKLENFFNNMCKEKGLPYTYKTKQIKELSYIIDDPTRISTIIRYYVFTKIK